MKPSDLTPYVWQRVLRIHDNDQKEATVWLKRQGKESIWQALLEYEGIINYATDLHHLHQHLFNPSELS